VSLRSGALTAYPSYSPHHEGSRDPARASALTSHRSGGVLVLANDTPLGTPTGRRLIQIRRRRSSNHLTMIEDRNGRAQASATESPPPTSSQEHAKRSVHYGAFQESWFFGSQPLGSYAVTRHGRLAPHVQSTRVYMSARAPLANDGTNMPAAVRRTRFAIRHDAGSRPLAKSSRHAQDKSASST